MGDTEINSFVPFQINYITEVEHSSVFNNKLAKPLSLKVIPCYEAVNVSTHRKNLAVLPVIIRIGRLYYRIFYFIKSICNQPALVLTVRQNVLYHLQQ